MDRNIALYPWFRFFQNLMFWHGIWFLYFQRTLSAADAILLYVVYDIATTALEVPSGYLSDRWGRKIALVASAASGLVGAFLLTTGNSFIAFALAQAALGASMAFTSGTDSALLYESLAAAARADEVERQELRAWRFGFVAPALAAVLGGAMALHSFLLPFLFGVFAYGATLWIALGFREPAHSDRPVPQGAELMRLTSLRAALTEPVLVWLFCLGLLMYVFSHVPYVFGQPFIFEALKSAGLETEAPLVSGMVSAAMMILSVIASLFALRLRERLGLPAILLLAFAMQIGVIAVLALTASTLAIAVLFLRMVPDSLSRPFILARIQPVLSDESRATYLSLRSFAARLVFSASLWFASLGASGEGEMAYDELRAVLGVYVLAGLIGLGALLLAAQRLPIEANPQA
ncbi:MFS transporter [Marimonas arenosa]|uniref:MFS transporter n=1 Tax=Marimonas arenosa TaxID=1795305 RepID=A0AAE4B395_9RHOB|nr:MFS transporter [Marimonas arenosa]MDQ2089823.1 MFS transporter [Marimonas arenosa]